MLASIIYNYGKFCDDFKSTLKLGAYVINNFFITAISIPVKNHGKPSIYNY